MVFVRRKMDVAKLVTVMKNILNKLYLLILLLISQPVFAAADSYRWFHVSIDDVWGIFIFLLPMVLFPAVLIAVLYWKYYLGKHKSQSTSEE